LKGSQLKLLPSILLPSILCIVGCVTDYSNVSSALDSERCGVIVKNGRSLTFQDSVSKKDRPLNVLDKSALEDLEKAGTQNSELCLTADWTTPGDVIVKTSSQIRLSDGNQQTEECGTIEEQGDGFYLVIHGTNSEPSSSKQITTESTVVMGVLKESALEERCIKANFKSDSINLTSPDQIRVWLK
jgi:hypothetical protein